jgi:hypothetical protein
MNEWMNEWMNDRVMNYINYSKCITQIAMNKRVTMKHSRTHIVMNEWTSYELYLLWYNLNSYK